MVFRSVQTWLRAQKDPVDAVKKRNVENGTNGVSCNSIADAHSPNVMCYPSNLRPMSAKFTVRGVTEFGPIAGKLTSRAKIFRSVTFNRKTMQLQGYCKGHHGRPKVQTFCRAQRGLFATSAWTRPRALWPPFPVSQGARDFRKD